MKGRPIVPPTSTHHQQISASEEIEALLADVEELRAEVRKLAGQVLLAAAGR